MPPKKPTALHIAQGTFRPDRHQVGVEATGTPQKPSTLTGPAAEHWDEVVPQIVELGVAREIDVRLLEVMCDTWAQMQRTLEAYREDVHDYRLRTSYVSLVNTYATVAGKFGMSPRDRDSIAAPPTHKPVGARKR